MATGKLTGGFIVTVKKTIWIYFELTELNHHEFKTF